MGCWLFVVQMIGRQVGLGDNFSPLLSLSIVQLYVIDLGGVFFLLASFDSLFVYCELRNSVHLPVLHLVLGPLVASLFCSVFAVESSSLERSLTP
jgi:hypothetical protein